MRVDCLARERGIFRAVKASPNGLTVTKIAQRQETEIRAIFENLEAPQPAVIPLFLIPGT